MKILALGSSHIFAIANSSWALSPHAWAFKWLGDFSNGMGSRIVLPEHGDMSGGHLRPDLEEWLEAYDDADLILLSVSGSDWLNFCISNRPEPFDFILPSAPDLPLTPGARIIPYAEIKEALRQHIRHIVLGVGLVAKHAKAPVAYLEPPPPIESNDHIAATAAWEKDAIASRGMTSPWLRLKFYRLHSELIAEACSAAGVPFHHVPDNARTENGFITPDGVGDDPMHATPGWAAKIIREVDRRYA